MSAWKMMCAVFLAFLLLGCGATVGTTTQIEEPETTIDDANDPEQPVPETDSASGQISVDFQYPEGWTHSFDTEQNQTVLRAPDGSTIYFTIWPLEEQTPFNMVMAIWEAMQQDVDEGAPIEPGEPTTAEFDGAEATYMISVLIVEGGQRITLMHAAFASNNPRFGILVSGIWPESNNAEMLMTFRSVAQSIRIQSE